MNQITLGAIIAKYRGKHNLRQQDICNGVCDRSTYIRVESGAQEVDFVVQETLLARLGQDAIDFEFMLDDDAYGVWSERLAIRSAMAGRQYSVVQDRIREYRRGYAGIHKLHEQFCLYYEMKLAQCWGENAVYICELAEKALSLTKTIGGMPEIKKNLYTPIEMDLLLTLLEYQYKNWNSIWQCRECLMKILEYISVYYSIESREDVQGRTWLELLKVEATYSESQQLLEYIERAISCFIGGNGILRLAEVRFFKAKLLHRISSTIEIREELEEKCRDECMIAYNIYDVLECTKEREAVERFCEEELQWHITTQMKWLD